MDDLDFVIETIDPWLDKYISQGSTALSTDEAIGVGVWLLVTEVANGGFDQYYFNSRGILAVQTVDALKKIGATETAGLLQAANADVPILPLPESRDECSKILDQVTEKSRFHALEREFYQDNDNRIFLLARYLRSTREGS